MDTNIKGFTVCSLFTYDSYACISYVCTNMWTLNNCAKIKIFVLVHLSSFNSCLEWPVKHANNSYVKVIVYMYIFYYIVLKIFLLLPSFCLDKNHILHPWSNPLLLLWMFIESLKQDANVHVHFLLIFTLIQKVQNITIFM